MFPSSGSALAFLVAGSLLLSAMESGAAATGTPAPQSQQSAAAGAPTGLSIADVRVVEGDAGARSVEVVISLTPAAKAPVSAAYSTADGTASASSDYRAANGSVTFAPGEIVKRITLGVVGDTAVETDETLTITLANASGAALADGTGTVTIVNDDFAGRGPAVYEVRITYTGASGSMEGAQGCPTRQNGKVVMTGLLAGTENVAADDDITYSGVLQFEADIDMCEVTGPDGNTRLCAMRLIGSGPMNAELELRFDDRGGYIKVSKAPGGFLSDISGSCDAELLDGERALFPDRSMATIFNGLELPLPLRTLRVGQYADGGVLVEVLRVVRR